MSNEAEQQFTGIGKSNLRPFYGVSPNRVPADETAIQIDSDSLRLYTPRTSKFLSDVLPAQNRMCDGVCPRSQEKRHDNHARFWSTLVDISQLRSHGLRYGLKSIATEISMAVSASSEDKTTNIPFSNTF